MKRYGLVTTLEAARLTGETDRNIRYKIQHGEYDAVAVDMPCGRGGKQYMVDITDLPKSAQMRYIAQMEGGNIGEADIVSYQQRYGDKGVNEVLMRRNAVLECRIIEKDGNGNITARKNELAARLGVTLRTIYRWRDAYEARGLAGLMDKIEQSNKGKPKNMCLFAQDVIKANLYSAAKHTNRSAYEKLKKLNTELGCKACERCPHCEGSIVRREMALQGAAQEYELCDQAGGGLVIPGSVSALNRYVQTIPADELAYARYGHRYWEAKYMPKAQRTKPEKINECWFGDHHMFDLFVIDDDGRIVRPWMTAWSDATSGAFVGWCITTNPNSTTIAETFVRAVAKSKQSPFYGVPSTIYIDNGKDYRSKRFEGDRETEHVIGRLNEKMVNTSLLQALGVAVIHAQPYKAWSKIIERLFGIIEDRYIRDLPGWCGNSPSQRPQDLTRAYLEKQAERGRLLTIAQFERIMREQIIPAYHNEAFDKEQSPLEIYESGEKARNDQPDWDVLAMIRTEQTVRKVSYMGIKLRNQWYWDDTLRHMVGQDVTVRYSKDDDLSISVIADNKFICEAALKDKLKLIGENEDKLAAHMQLQHRSAQEVRSGISNAKRAVQVGLRNVYYEPIDVMAAGTGNITTLEYRRAAKAKAARRAELAEEVRRNKASEDTANDTVRDMFMAMGRARGNK